MADRRIGRLKRIAAASWTTRTNSAMRAGALSIRIAEIDAGIVSADHRETAKLKDERRKLRAELADIPRLTAEQSELAELYQLAYTRLAELSSDPDVRELIVREVVKGRGASERVETQIWTTEEWMNAVFEFLLTFAISGALDEQTPIRIVKDEALSYVQRARDLQLERGAAPSPRMELLPPRDLAEKLRYRVSSGLKWEGDRPPAIGRLPRPGEASRLRRDEILAARQTHDIERDMVRFEQQLRAAREQSLREQRGIELRRGPGGTVSAGPKKMKRGRKRGGRKR